MAKRLTFYPSLALIIRNSEKTKLLANASFVILMGASSLSLLSPVEHSFNALIFDGSMMRGYFTEKNRQNQQTFGEEKRKIIL